MVGDELAECRAAIASLLADQLRAAGVGDMGVALDDLAVGMVALANGLSVERLADPTLSSDLFPCLIGLLIAGAAATAR